MSNHIIKAETLKSSVDSLDRLRRVNSAKEIMEHYPGYLIDESKLMGEAEQIFFPNNEDELLKVIHYLNEKNQSYYVCGARTGIVGSSVPLSGVVVSLEKMDNFIGLGYDESKEKYFARAQPGLTLTEIIQFLEQKRLSKLKELTDGAFESFENKSCEINYPIDPTEMSASIGGTVATNASGARTFKYGATRDWVKRIRVVLPTGEILNINRGEYQADGRSFSIETDDTTFELTLPSYTFNTEVKNAAGIYVKPNMDLIDLFMPGWSPRR